MFLDTASLYFTNTQTFSYCAPHRGLMGTYRLRHMTSYDARYVGMSVNERLYWAGLIDAWDAAIQAGDRQVAIDLLGRVDLASQAAAIVDTTLANPAKYGFPTSP